MEANNTSKEFLQDLEVKKIYEGSSFPCPTQHEGDDLRWQENTVSGAPAVMFWSLCVKM